MRDTFSSYHPIVNFTYFTFVLLCSMFLLNPVCLCISLGGALIYSTYLNGKKSLLFQVKYMIPMLIITAIMNPAFNHEGATVLTYLKNGNPITLESILYGISAATMLVTVICWFSCYNKVMTSDKFIYLFGRVIPSLSLILSMVFRFVPKMKSQITVISNAQKCIGHDTSNGNIIQRLKHGIRILSIMVTWSLENSIETADSMKSRGYGLKGRSAFSIFKFEARDKTLMSVMLIIGLYFLFGVYKGSVSFIYFPIVKWAVPNFFNITIFIAYFTLCNLPLAINIWEDRKWKLLQLNI